MSRRGKVTMTPVDTDMAYTTVDKGTTCISLTS